MSKKNCSCYDCTWRRERQEFLHTHDGPEEMPHRKKKSIKGRRKVYDHKHLYENNGWEKHYRWIYEAGRLAQDKTRWCMMRPWICLFCGKTEKVEREYPPGSRWY